MTTPTNNPESIDEVLKSFLKSCTGYLDESVESYVNHPRFGGEAKQALLTLLTNEVIGEDEPDQTEHYREIGGMFNGKDEEIAYSTRITYENELRTDQRQKLDRLFGKDTE